MINWIQGTGVDNLFPTTTMPDTIANGWNPAWTVQATYHGVSMYPMFYVIGMLLAIMLCLWNFYRKQLSIVDLAIGVIIIIPCSLFGGSFFGKLNADGIGQNAGGVGFWGLFAFWHAGMAIHGGVFTGVAVGVIIFGIIGHHTKTSLWVYMDAIIPNILIGQAFGRWGNFFNHEVMGAPMYDVTAGVGHNPLSWLPHYITQNTQVIAGAVAKGDPGYGTQILGHVNGMDIIAGHVYQLSPLFLWESMAFFIAWGLIVFIIPNIGKWFGPKPWKRHKDLYTLSWKQTFLNIFQFWKVPMPQHIEEMTDKIYQSGETPNNNNEPAWTQSWFSIWKQAYEYNPDYNERQDYYQTIYDVEHSTQCLTKKRYKMCQALNKANNPEGYWMTKVGCQASAYFFAWNITRFACELQRPDDHLFIMYNKPLSLSIIGVSALLGIIGMVMTQTIAPMFFRQPGYQYEKPYFDAEPIVKHWWISSKKLNSMNMQESTIKPMPAKVARKAIKEDKAIEVEDARVVEQQKKAEAKLAKMKAKQRMEASAPVQPVLNKDVLEKQRKAQEKLAKMKAKDAKVSKKPAQKPAKKSQPVVDDKILAKQKKAEAKLAKMKAKNNKN